MNHEAAKKRFLEQAEAYFDDLQTTGRQAPDGQVINQMEALVLQRGSELIRQSLQLALQEEVENHEKKRNAARKCQAKKRRRGYKSKKIVTAVGSIKLKRK